MHSLFAIALLTATTTGQVSATLLDGSVVEGAVVDWDARGVRLQAGDDVMLLAVDELLGLRWHEQNETVTQAKTFVELIDGSRIPFAAFQVTERVATVTLRGMATKLEIPTRQISKVQLLPDAPDIGALWQKLDEKQLAGDVLIVRKRAGQSLDYLPGMLGDLTDKQLKFRFDGETIPVKRSKVAALVYYHAKQPKLQEPICKITTAEGGQLSVCRVKLDDNILSVTTPSGISLEMSIGSLASADFSLGKLVYLSDLKPLSVRWTPRVAMPKSARLVRDHGMPRGDHPFGGALLALSWPASNLADNAKTKIFSKGLAIRSRTEIVYRLPKGMHRFQTTAGIDPATAAQGNVQLTFICDEQTTWQGEIDGKRPPVDIGFDLQDASRLKIIVDYGKNLDLGDRLHLVDARVTK